MSELNYVDLESEIVAILQKENTIFLATCANNKVTVRAMAHINDGLNVLFGTSKNSEKIRQMDQNPNIALAIGNIKIEAIAELFGHPKGHPFFTNEYLKKFPQYGKIYPEKPDDILVIAKPIKISLFKFLGKPCEDILEITNNSAYRIDLI